MTFNSYFDGRYRQAFCQVCQAVLNMRRSHKKHFATLTKIIVQSVLRGPVIFAMHLAVFGICLYSIACRDTTFRLTDPSTGFRLLRTTTRKGLRRERDDANFPVCLDRGFFKAVSFHWSYSTSVFSHFWTLCTTGQPPMGEATASSPIRQSSATHLLMQMILKLLVECYMLSS